MAITAILREDITDRPGMIVPLRCKGRYTLLHTLGADGSTLSEWVLNRALDTFVRAGPKDGWTSCRLCPSELG
jgi:hypothetical protein